MTFDNLVEKLAQKYADDVNPCRKLSGMAPRSSWYYKREATVAVNMLWPLVEAAEKQNKFYPESTGHWIGQALTKLQEG